MLKRFDALGLAEQVQPIAAGFCRSDDACSATAQFTDGVSARLRFKTARARMEFACGR